MIKEAILGVTFTVTLATTGAALAEPGKVQVRQAGVELAVHPVAGEPNLFAAYFEPADYAFQDREQYNVNLLYSMNGAPYADGVAVTYPANLDFAEVGPGVTWTSSAIRYVSGREVPIALNFDPLYGTRFVLVFDRSSVDLGVRVVGDVNGDGHSDIIDALLIAKASTGLVTFSQVEKGVADVNCDYAVNIVDALLVAKASVGEPNVTLGCP